jgi:hypothetical protein
LAHPEATNLLDLVAGSRANVFKVLNLVYRNDRWKGLIHADCRMDNFFYAVTGRDALIDFQLSCPGSPGRDLAYPLVCDLSPQARRDNQVRLVERYREICGDGTADEYWHSYREGLVFTCVLVMIITVIVDLDDPRVAKLLPVLDKMVGGMLEVISDEKLLPFARELLSSKKIQ